jgi:hypothetical protein
MTGEGEETMKPTKTSEPNGNGFTKQFELADGRKTTVARNVVAFCVAHKVDPEQKTIIGLRVSSVRPITVLAVYDDVRMWWSAQPSPSRNAGQEL